MERHISIRASDGSGEFSAYLALPPTGFGPGIVVGQEIFGVNSNIRGISDYFAAQGYVVLAPDLFWRIEPGVELGYTETGLERAYDLMGRFDVDKGVEDITAALQALTEMPEVNGHATGFVGFCLGGKLAYLTTARTEVTCAVGYYGVDIDKFLELAPDIRDHLVLHFGDRDKLYDDATLTRIEKTLAPYDNIEVYRYPEADHAFARINGANYHQQSAELAHERTLAALKRCLGPND